jgi:hypothetical protein
MRTRRQRARRGGELTSAEVEEKLTKMATKLNTFSDLNHQVPLLQHKYDQLQTSLDASIKQQHENTLQLKILEAQVNDMSKSLLKLLPGETHLKEGHYRQQLVRNFILTGKI